MDIAGISVVDITAPARSKVPAMPALPPSPADASRTKRIHARSMGWLQGAALASGLLAAMACSGALAGDAVEDALSLVTQGRYAEAREALEPMLEREPGAPGVRLLHGVLHAREGNLVEAVAVFESLRNDHPTMFEAHNNLAVLYAKLGRLDDARKALVAAVELKQDAVVYANLGDVYMKLAEQAYQRAREFRDQGVAASEGEGQTTADLEPVEMSDETEEMPNEPPTTATAEDRLQDLTVESQEPKIPTEPDAAPAQAPMEVCIHAGWFKDSEAAYEAAAWMRARGAVEIQVHSEEQQVIKNYQVYLPPASSREEATAMAHELRGRGVDDLWIIDRGERTNGISLGVFRNKRYMSRRVAELEKLGFPVMTTANTEAVTEYAVEARADSDRSAFDDAWNAEFPEHSIGYVDCADPT